MLLSERQLAVKLKKNIRTIVKWRKQGVIKPHMQYKRGSNFLRYYLWPDVTAGLTKVYESPVQKSA